MSDYYKIKTTDFEWSKFVQLVADHWKVVQALFYYCRKHKVFFNVQEEPCWECYNSCIKQDEKEG